MIREHGKEKRELTQKEIFKAWMMLGLSLSDTGQLKGWHKSLVDTFSQSFRDFLKTNK